MVCLVQWGTRVEIERKEDESIYQKEGMIIVVVVGKTYFSFHKRVIGGVK